eukprot:3998807-Lingulodinium_polyedra.AAC.1
MVSVAPAAASTTGASRFQPAANVRVHRGAGGVLGRGAPRTEYVAWNIYPELGDCRSQRGRPFGVEL